MGSSPHESHDEDAENRSRPSSSFSFSKMRFSEKRKERTKLTNAADACKVFLPCTTERHAEECILFRCTRCSIGPTIHPQIVMSPLKYHDGELTVQKRADAFDPADLEGNGLGVEFDERGSTFLAQQPWVVIAAQDRDGRVWSSLLHGPAGFLSTSDPSTLAIDASLPAGDPLAESFESANEIGLLVLDPRTRRRLRINGRAQATKARKLVVTTREVYGNCPKYIQRREIVETVAMEVGQAIPASILDSDQRDFIARADTFFIGSLHAEAGIDCSHRGGNPGFVRAIDDRRLAFPDYSGNNMFQTLGNLTLDGRAGLLFLDFQTGDMLQLTGQATIIWDSPRLAEWPDARRLIEFEIAGAMVRRNAFPLRWRLVEYSPFNPKV
jgi:predicted pyridoxine 5'-phosphate oxidase superfamily flavin-nucleotide-binding protein